jgi:hypothetical protein
MNFDFVDIGTSDFDTSLNERDPGQTVLLVEPVFEYLSRLSDGEGVLKAPFAISNRSGYRPMHFIDPDTIREYNLPDFIRGCNSFGYQHPTVIKLLKECGVEDQYHEIVTVKTVRVITFEKLLNLYDIKKIGFLKIDTEGHDHIILKEVLARIKEKKVKIDKIKFEYNPVFGNTKELHRLIKSSDFGNAEFTGDNWILS